MAASQYQFKVNQLAKDLDMKGKDIISVLTDTGFDVKSQSSLEALEFGVLLDTLTKQNQIEGIDDYIDGITYIESKKKKPEAKEEITIDDFMKTELRVAKVIACERIKKAKKLLKLQLDLGYEKRQVVSGIAQFYEPEDLIGKKVVIVANLKPVKLCGEDSFGMILCAANDNQLSIVSPVGDMELGSEVR